MKTKGWAIILILALLIFASGSVYSSHPWEELNNDDGPFGCSPRALQDDYKVIMIPIFSNFLIWIYVKDGHKEGEHQKNSVKVEDNSYQIIFPW
jgi:hypothetical protein